MPPNSNQPEKKRLSRPDVLEKQRNSRPELDSDFTLITTSELNSILDVNQKAITIYLEVEKNQEEILESYSSIKDELEALVTEIKSNYKETDKNSGELDKKILDIDKNLFRLVIVLGTLASALSVGTIIAIIKLISGK